MTAKSTTAKITRTTGTIVAHQDQIPDVHEMLVIHRVFRREFAAFPGLVRGVPDGAVRRARTVGRHLQLILAGLHMHHVGEDAVLWPRLLDRASATADLVRTMEEQHAAVDARVAELEPEVAAWIATASARRGEHVSMLVDQLAEALFAHLDLEERETLSLIEQHITAAEWATLAEHGKESMSARQLPLMFGAILEDADQDERRQLLAALPAPIRLLMRTLGVRRYRRYITRVRTA